VTEFVFEPKRYPTKPGCYLMKDARGRVIYVGKAKSLRRRLANYFQPHWKDRKTFWLVSHIAGIEVILVSNETESLVLENNLIKQYKPRYNRFWVGDESSYPYIVLTHEKVPRFLPYRKRRYNKALEGLDPENDLERRFGPYIGWDYRNALLEFVTETFQIRTCKVLPKKVCLRYHLHKCSGICAGLVSPDEYSRCVNAAADFLNDRHAIVIEYMKARMLEHAERLEFEQAQRIRDQAVVLESVLTNQVVEREVAYDQDVVYFGEGQALVAEIQRGILRTVNLYDLPAVAGGEDACAQFLLQHYTQAAPEEIITNRLAGAEQMQTQLAQRCGHPVTLRIPEQAAEHNLLSICEMNYEYRKSQK
jgi:excinuclease ABC subunit C